VLFMFKLSDEKFHECCLKSEDLFGKQCLKENICRYNITFEEVIVGIKNFIRPSVNLYFMKLNKLYSIQLFKVFKVKTGTMVLKDGVCELEGLQHLVKCASQNKDHETCCHSLNFDKKEKENCMKFCMPNSEEKWDISLAGLMKSKQCSKHLTSVLGCFRKNVFGV